MRETGEAPIAYLATGAFWLCRFSRPVLAGEQPFLGCTVYMLGAQPS